MDACYSHAILWPDDTHAQTTCQHVFVYLKPTCNGSVLVFSSGSVTVPESKVLQFILVLLGLQGTLHAKCLPYERRTNNSIFKTDKFKRKLLGELPASRASYKADPEKKREAARASFRVSPDKHRVAKRASYKPHGTKLILISKRKPHEPVTKLTVMRTGQPNAPGIWSTLKQKRRQLACGM